MCDWDWKDWAVLSAVMSIVSALSLAVAAVAG